MSDFQDIQSAIVQLMTNLQIYPERASEALQQTEVSLSQLWDQAEARKDLPALELIASAWQQAQALAVQNHDLIATATDTGRVALQAVQQRNAALDELEGEQQKNERMTVELAYVSDQLETIENEIEDILISGDTEAVEHPRLRELVTTVQEMAQEEWEAEGLHLQCPGCAASEIGWYDAVSHDAVNELCYALFHYGDELPAELRGEIGAMLMDIAQKLNAWHKQNADTFAQARVRAQGDADVA